MNIYTDLLGLLLDGGGEGSFTYSLLPYLFSFFLFLSILVWESINNSTLVLKRDFHVSVVLASDQVQILIWIYNRVQQNVAHLAGAVDYTNCFSVER